MVSSVGDHSVDATVTKMSCCPLCGVDHRFVLGDVAVVLGGVSGQNDLIGRRHDLTVVALDPSATSLHQSTLRICGVGPLRFQLISRFGGSVLRLDFDPFEMFFGSSDVAGLVHREGVHTHQYSALGRALSFAELTIINAGVDT